MFAKKIESRRGVAVLEAALTLPIVCYLLFFLLEMAKINITQTAIETITAEATFYFIAYGKMMEGNVNKIDEIIEKYRPSFIPTDRIKYWFRLYKEVTAGDKEGLKKMCSASPYGGEEIAYDPNANSFLDDHVGIQETSSLDFIDSDRNLELLCPGTGSYIGDVDAKNYINGTNPAPAGTAFVITFSCGYPFSSPFVKKLFNGGSNTVNKSTKQKGSTYLLWGRGVGVVN